MPRLSSATGELPLIAERSYYQIQGLPFAISTLAVPTNCRYKGASTLKKAKDAFMAYNKELPASMVKSLAQRAAPSLAPEYNATPRDTSWAHVYNELPGTGTQQARIQCVAGTDDEPVPVQIPGTI